MPLLEKKSNRIDRIYDCNGVWKSDERRMQSVMMDYFGSIFSSNRAVMNDFEECLSPKVSLEQSELLLSSISFEEV